MKDEVLERIKAVEKKLQNGEELNKEDNVFLFALSLIKGKSADQPHKG